MTHNLSLTALHDFYSQGGTVRERILELREQALAQADYNAWIYLLSPDELEAYFQTLEAKSPETHPLYGVPFAIKDNIDLAGVPTTAACESFAYTPDEHAYVVQRLIDAGAIPLGKTNLDQFATGLVGTRSPYGQGKNAFNPDYISGGSSAGSAISTALGQVSFALGTDTAGSGRVPAALNNLIGLKPTRGVLSTRGVVPACRSLDCVSIFALTTADAATVFNVAAAEDTKDAFARATHSENSARYYSGSPKTSFTFGVPDRLEFQGNPRCETLFHNAVGALKALGGKAVTLPFAPFYEAAKLLYEGPWVAERWLATEAVPAEAMLDTIRTIIKSGDQARATDAFRAQYRLAELKRECDALMAGFDFVLTPTMPTVYTRAELDEAPIERNSILGTYTNFMNLLDYSACAVPAGRVEGGVYWGVTLFGQAHHDIALLNVAAALQNHWQFPLGATGHALDSKANTRAGLPAVGDSVDVVVCGAHLSGQPLNWQLIDRGATLVSCTHSAKQYRLLALADGKRPAMMPDSENGAAIEVEVWRMPTQHFGSFVAAIPSPLGIGKVVLEDGKTLPGFICDGSGLEGSTDITEYGSWRAWRKTQ